MEPTVLWERTAAQLVGLHKMGLHNSQLAPETPPSIANQFVMKLTPLDALKLLLQFLLQEIDSKANGLTKSHLTDEYGNCDKVKII